MDSITTHALKETGLSKLANAIFFHCPNLERVTARLGEFLLDVIPDEDGRPLFHECVKSACASYEVAARALQTTGAVTEEESHRALTMAYLTGLIRPAGVLNNIKVYVEKPGAGGQIVWEMFVESLRDFKVRNTKPLQVIDDAWGVNEEDVRVLLAARILDMRDLSVLKSFYGLLENLRG